ncbi:MAG: sigma-70 family RNA polymerase sigma factor [Nannocystaceae bacterium]
MRASPLATEPAPPTTAAAAGSTSGNEGLSALAAVYRDHHAYVHRVLGRLGVPVDLVDDALQDVFLVVHRRLGEFEGRSALRTWLFSIALRIARKYRASAARRPEPLAAPIVDARESPEDLADRRRALALLDALLAQLSDDRREVLVLCEIERLSAPEAAEVLGLKLNTVYSRLRLARQDFERAVQRLQAREQRLARPRRSA